MLSRPLYTMHRQVYSRTGQNVKSKHWIVGNWKMNGSRQAVQQWLAEWQLGCNKLTASASRLEILVCPPAIYLPFFAEQITTNNISRLKLVGQNVSAYLQGAYTGELSAAMLQDYQCSHVLIGHSERRQLFAETDEVVAQKVATAQAQGLRPILCVGETQAQREQQATESVVTAQLDSVLKRIGAEKLAQAIIAYEPIWAIGTGLSATPEQAQAVHASIRAWLGNKRVGFTPLLYGGSVSPDNAAAVLRQPDIDGVLVGGASLVADSFLKICAVLT